MRLALSLRLCCFPAAAAAAAATAAAAAATAAGGVATPAPAGKSCYGLWLCSGALVQREAVCSRPSICVAPAAAAAAPLALLERLRMKQQGSGEGRGLASNEKGRGNLTTMLYWAIAGVGADEPLPASSRRRRGQGKQGRGGEEATSFVRSFVSFVRRICKPWDWIQNRAAAAASDIRSINFAQMNMIQPSPLPPPLIIHTLGSPLISSRRVSWDGVCYTYY
jgi:hypothetical protein